MRKWLSVLLSLTLFLAPINTTIVKSNERPVVIALADDTVDVQVPIPMECRVGNRSGSQCVWCSLECLARYHHVEAAMHLTDVHKGTAGSGNVKSVLDSLGVKYQQQQNRDTKFLEDICVKGWGAGVGLNGTHMVNVVHFKDDVVKIIDNSDSSLRIQTWTRAQFIQRFDGWVVTLIPSQSPKPPQSGQPIQLPPRPPSSIR